MDRLKRQWLIICGLAAVIIVGSFWGHWQKAAAPERTTGLVPAVPAAEAGRPVVYVGGAVAKPGVYTLAPASRVADAVAAAGGFIPGADTARVNLAQAVSDGMQVYVPAARSAGAPAFAAKININTAGREELEKLPGIGPVLALRIIDYRLAHGPFRDLGDIKRVSGIGESKFNQIKDKIAL